LNSVADAAVVVVAVAVIVVCVWWLSLDNNSICFLSVYYLLTNIQVNYVDGVTEDNDDSGL
jgi:ABC-type nitrate/sulfonate/bicarbonate transport system permease component